MTTSHSNLPAVPEEPKQLTLQERAEAIPDRVFKPGAAGVVLTLVVGGILSLGGYSLAQSSIVGKIDAGVAEESKKRQQLQDAFEEHLKDDRESKRRTEQVMGELGADIRALYRAQQTGQPQARLERPPQLPDGGP